MMMKKTLLRIWGNPKVRIWGNPKAKVINHGSLLLEYLKYLRDSQYPQEVKLAKVIHNL
jgi:hypothetical protein